MLFFTIIFDEVQYAPNVLESLKYFCEDAPEYTCGEASAFSDRYIQLLKEYYVVGGMPEVVKSVFVYCLTFVNYSFMLLFIELHIYKT